MRQGLLANVVRALAACLLSAAAAAAQEAPPAPPAPSKLVVQVVYKKGAKPSYLEVPGCAWYSWFGSTPAAASRAAADTVQAVDVRTNLKDGRVELKVGVHVGERFFDRLDAVGTYTAALGETVEAGDLEGVGVEPFGFRVLRVNASDTAAPVVVNRTQSIAAAVTDFTPAPLPRAKLTLTNLSSKRVRAVMLQTLVGGRVRTSMMSMEFEGKTLMEPGGTHERRVGITDGSSTETTFTPQTIEGVVVAAVVFEDYTYEGDAEPAATKFCMDEGERAQLPRVMELVRAAHAARDVESAESLRRFKAALSALDDTAPQSSVDAVLAGYSASAPATSRSARGGVEVSMHRVRTELLNDLEHFEKKAPAAPAEHSFKRWLKEHQARFEGWLARL